MHERAKKGWKNEHLWTCDMSLMLWYMSLTVLFQSLETARPWIQAAEGRWFLFSKEELSIRFTLSVDNPNIDHFVIVWNLQLSCFRIERRGQDGQSSVDLCWRAQIAVPKRGFIRFTFICGPCQLLEEWHFHLQCKKGRPVQIFEASAYSNPVQTRRG